MALIFQNKFLLNLMTFILIFTAIACSRNEPAGKTEAEVLYKKALKNVSSGRYLQATEHLNTIKIQHPYSFYSTHAELLLADILFLQEQFVESAAAYILFKDMHPKNEKTVYVTWKIGESYYNQIPSTFDRDLTPAREAIKYYSDIVERFSTTEYVEKSKSRIQLCTKMLEQKEKYIADFYFRVDKYDAARFRYLMIVDEFKSAELLEHAKKRIVESSFKIDDYQGCINYADKFFMDLSDDAKKEVNVVKGLCQNKLTVKKL